MRFLTQELAAVGFVGTGYEKAIIPKRIALTCGGIALVGGPEAGRMNPGTNTFNRAGSKVTLARKLTLTARTTTAPKIFSELILLSVNTPKPPEIAKKLNNSALPVLG